MLKEVKKMKDRLNPFIYAGRNYDSIATPTQGKPPLIAKPIDGGHEIYVAFQPLRVGEKKQINKGRPWRVISTDGVTVKPNDIPFDQQPKGRLAKSRYG